MTTTEKILIALGVGMLVWETIHVIAILGAIKAAAQLGKRASYSITLVPFWIGLALLLAAWVLMH